MKISVGKHFLTIIFFQKSKWHSEKKKWQEKFSPAIL